MMLYSRTGRLLQALVPPPGRDTYLKRYATRPRSAVVGQAAAYRTGDSTLPGQAHGPRPGHYADALLA